jgi:MFS transporter, PPP family, 3-phenylpropionic acid transporter
VDHPHHRQRNRLAIWALSVVAEIGVFLCMPRWLPRFGPRVLLLAAIAVAAVRWLLTATLASYLSVMLVTQAMHAGSFGLDHAAAIYSIYQFFPGRLQGRGQAPYSSLSFSLGGAVGSLMSGCVVRLRSAVGFVAAALIAGAGVLVVWRGVRRPFHACHARHQQAQERL